MQSSLLLKTYIGFAIIYLGIQFLNIEGFDFYMKPVLLPILLAAVVVSDNFPSKKILLTALTFSWIGDIILLFTDRGELYFIFGLVAFLVSHLVYIILFSKQQNTRTNDNKVLFWVGVLVIIVYFIFMIDTLFPKLGPLKIPVLVYAIVITTMLFFAFKGSLKWAIPANNYILIGAIVFVSSDSILAFNKFYAPIEHASFYIMATYCLAQYLIVAGILKLNSKI
ncbi:putative membrane protein YhhN [Flavobacterium sp. 103]|uniref:lysoplasmalogenase n=1 Tax=Flavobacterium sp. 103 TaxID=2135624 RepID=UPI000D5F90B4|nr:lysoplasmalogenase [Flavobacterium sp. 103]PVX47266.1 putative membrane protein YhhN [Flavobacterium sp. 103]